MYPFVQKKTRKPIMKINARPNCLAFFVIRFDSYLFQIRSTATPRTEKSAVAYGEGAFPGEPVEMERPRDDDEVLRVRIPWY